MAVAECNASACLSGCRALAPHGRRPTCMSGRARAELEAESQQKDKAVQLEDYTGGPATNRVPYQEAYQASHDDACWNHGLLECVHGFHTCACRPCALSGPWCQRGQYASSDNASYDGSRSPGQQHELVATLQMHRSTLEVRRTCEWTLHGVGSFSMEVPIRHQQLLCLSE